MKGTLNKWVKNAGLAFSTSVLMMTGVAGSATAAGYCDPCANYDCCEMPDYVVYADFLYWQANVQGLEYARTGYQFGLNPESITEQGKLYSPGCEWTPGFRVGAIVDLGCCEWDFFAQYTWLRPDSSCSVEGPAFLEPTILSDLILDLITPFENASAHANFKIDFNVLDFGLGRTFNVNECFVFRPHFGFKATWQKLHYDVTYRRVEDSVVVENIIQASQDFDGIGLRAGFDAAWKFSPCFSILGKFALSSLYSDIDAPRQDNTITPVIGGPTENVVIGLTKNDVCTLIPVLELFLGIRWDTTVCDCYDMYVQIGWENQVWFDYNNLVRYSLDATGPHGNFTLQGLTVGAGMAF